MSCYFAFCIKKSITVRISFAKCTLEIILSRSDCYLYLIQLIIHSFERKYDILNLACMQFFFIKNRQNEDKQRANKLCCIASMQQFSAFKIEYDWLIHTSAKMMKIEMKKSIKKFFRKKLIPRWENLKEIKSKPPNRILRTMFILKGPLALEL